jgi:hypothetical protein
VKMSVTGRSAGFVAGAGTNTRARELAKNNEAVTAAKQTSSVSGYQFASKWDSAAWQNLMGLFTFYRNNGYIYDTAGRPRSEAHLFIGNIEIAYDQWVYVGNFENFTYQYEEGKQHGAVQFTFEFNVSFMYDRAQGGAVRPINSPTPSPSAAMRGNAPFLPDPQANAVASISPAQDGDPSTAILDSLIDPFESRFPSVGSRTGATTIDPFAP